MNTELNKNSLEKGVKYSLYFDEILKGSEYSEHYGNKDKFILTQISLESCYSGLQGELILCVPPTDEGLEDAWEASCPAGEWDYYAWLYYYTCFIDNKPFINICYRTNTFFDKEGLIASLPCAKFSNYVLGTHNDNLESAWEGIILPVFKEHFNLQSPAGMYWNDYDYKAQKKIS